MLTGEEIEKKLFAAAQEFRKLMSQKKYLKAKICYDNARTVAVAVGLEESKMTALFGNRQADPPIEGAFREWEVQKAYEQYIFKMRQTEKAEQQRRDQQILSRSDRLTAFRREMGK